MATTTIDQAWRAYQDLIEDQRQILLSQPWADDPELRVAAHEIIAQIQAHAWNHVIGGRTDSPILYSHATYFPGVYNWGNPCVDFNYHYSFLDGARRYRLYGNRGTSHALDMQVQGSYYGGPGARKTWASMEFDDLKADPDGNFEAVIAAEPQPGNWIALDPDSAHNFMLFREIFADWGCEKPARLHLENLDPATPATASTEAQLVERLDRAGQFIAGGLAEFVVKRQQTLLATVGMNKFSGTVIEKNTSAVHPKAYYPAALFELEADSAILIECPLPNARYWNVQVLDFWRGAVNYADRQSSLNLAQAHVDADGVFRAVLSAVDPGVPNWLDTAGRTTGLLQFRFFFGDVEPVPTMRSLPLAAVREHLPADTPSVTPEHRTAQLADRRRGALSRFGY